MKKCSKILFLALAFFVLSPAFAQIGFSNHDRTPYNDRDDIRYRDEHYAVNHNNNNRFDNNRYNNTINARNWLEIGSKNIASHKRINKIFINPRIGFFDQLKFEVNGLTDIYRVAVQYDNGLVQELKVLNNTVRKDARGINSIFVDLPNRNKNIHQIIFWSDNSNFRTSPLIKNKVVVSVR